VNQAFRFLGREKKKKGRGKADLFLKALVGNGGEGRGGRRGNGCEVSKKGGREKRGSALGIANVYLHFSSKREW